MPPPKYDLIIHNGKEWPFPPLTVFHDGSQYWISDGFHRWLAAQDAKRGSIPCTVHPGTAKDARIHGMTANDQHGLRMTRADKRACVEWLLDNGGKMTQKEIAETAGVSPRTVQTVVFERKPPSNGGENWQVANSPPHPGGAGSGSSSSASGGSEGEPSGTSSGTSEGGSQEPEPPDPGKARTLAHKYRDSLARAVCDYHELKPNRAERDRIVKLVQGIELWK